MLLTEGMAQRLAVYAACNPQGPLKKWEHYPLNSNGHVVRLPMPIKSGDTVQIITGSDKGKVGKVTKVGRCSGQPCLTCESTSDPFHVIYSGLILPVDMAGGSEDGADHSRGRQHQGERIAVDPEAAQRTELLAPATFQADQTLELGRDAKQQ